MDVKTMTDPYLMIWFLATAMVTTTVLTVRTLAAADLLPRRKRDGSFERNERSSSPSRWRSWSWQSLPVVLATRRTTTPPSEPIESTARSRPYVEAGPWSAKTYPADAVVVGYDAKEPGRAAIAFAVEERRGVNDLVVLQRLTTGDDRRTGPVPIHRDPGALEAAEEVTARGGAEARGPSGARGRRRHRDHRAGAALREPCRTPTSWSSEPKAGRHRPKILGGRGTTPGDVT